MCVIHNAVSVDLFGFDASMMAWKVKCVSLCNTDFSESGVEAGCERIGTFGQNVHHEEYVEVSRRMRNTCEAGAFIRVEEDIGRPTWARGTMMVERPASGGQDEAAVVILKDAFAVDAQMRSNGLRG